MKAKGKELEFISVIKSDGSGTTPVSTELSKVRENKTFDLIRLSISEDTYIAVGFNCYVVKLKNNES